MQFIPRRFGSLLHHIVPSVYLILLEIVQQIERSAGKTQNLGLILRKFLHYSLAQFRLCTFVRLVHNDTVTSGGKHFIVLIKVAAYKFRTTQVLHGSKVNIFALSLFSSCFQRNMAVTVIL